MTLNEELLTLANEAKTHLEKYPMSVVDTRIEKEIMEQAKEVFQSVLGDQSMKRVTFLPSYLED